MTPNEKLRPLIYQQGIDYANTCWKVLESPNEHDNAREDFIAGAQWLLTKLEDEQVLKETEPEQSLPMYNVDELNEIVKEYNKGEVSLFDFVGRVWNKAYFVGANEGMKANNI